MTSIHSLSDFRSKDFSDVINLYTKSFPPDERIPLDRITGLLEKERAYLFIAKENDRVIGLLFLCIFPEIKISLLGYVAVDEKHQGKGIGKMLFGHALNELEKKLPGCIGMIIEVEKISNYDENESDLRMRNLKFYRKMGVKMFQGVNYLQPAQQGNVPVEMHLLFAPLNTNMNAISRHTLLEYIRTLYLEIYHYPENDLFEKLSNSIPDTINLVENY